MVTISVKLRLEGVKSKSKVQIVKTEATFVRSWCSWMLRNMLFLGRN